MKDKISTSDVHSQSIMAFFYYVEQATWLIYFPSWFQDLFNKRLWQKAAAHRIEYLNNYLDSRIGNIKRQYSMGPKLERHMHEARKSIQTEILKELSYRPSSGSIKRFWRNKLLNRHQPLKHS